MKRKRVNDPSSKRLNKKLIRRKRKLLKNSEMDSTLMLSSYTNKLLRFWIHLSKTSLCLRRKSVSLKATSTTTLHSAMAKISKSNNRLNTVQRSLIVLFYLKDINVLIKAYLRCGLAYEHMEKYKLAANDLYRVREL